MITVLYDETCNVCRRARRWLEVQPQLVPLVFVAAASAEAKRKFPDLDHPTTLRKITVVADDGRVFEEERAWLVCLWALQGWRPTAIRFSEPGKEKYVLTATRMAERLRAMGKDDDYREPSGGTCTADGCQG
jgi:predicted DCC family thiol-disulfide oxidoreductase YuxK